MELSDAQILAAMHRLGLERSDFRVKTSEALIALQARARKAYRKAVAELHPDKTAGDREKELQLIALGVVMEEVQALRVVEPPAKRKIRMRFSVRM